MPRQTLSRLRVLSRYALALALLTALAGVGTTFIALAVTLTEIAQAPAVKSPSRTDQPSRPSRPFATFNPLTKP